MANLKGFIHYIYNIYVDLLCQAHVCLCGPMFDQSGTKCGVGSQRTFFHFFWLLTRILNFFCEPISLLLLRFLSLSPIHCRGL